jgi:serine phosphatase RsbU (regulator of sigma subunit)
MTDGYQDQFGGPNGKKFKFKQLESLITQISHMSLQEQSKELHDAFFSWKGHLEQVDDVTIIGIKI